MKTKDIAIGDLRTDGGTQSRAEINMDTVYEYRDAWQSSVEFPPLDVFHDGAEHWLADGFHRFYGAREAKCHSVPCVVHKGTVDDARMFAAAANAKHGLKRSNPDKRKSVEIVLELHPEWSDRRIAEHCGVGHPLAAYVRKSQLEESSSSSPEDNHSSPEPAFRIGRDGKKRRVQEQPVQSPEAVATADEEERDIEEEAEEYYVPEESQSPQEPKGLPSADSRSEQKKKALAAIGFLVRYLEKLGCYDKHRAELSRIQARVEAVK